MAVGHDADAHDEPSAGDTGADPVCWLDRVCEACGALTDGPPQPVCERCGHARS